MDILKIFKAECTSRIHFNFLLYFYLCTVGLSWLSILNIVVCTCQSHLSIDWWMDKGEVEHTFKGILPSHSKEWNNAICSKMDGSGDYHTEWSKSAKTNIIEYLIQPRKRCEWTYLQNRKKLTDLENEFMVIRGGK